MATFVLVHGAWHGAWCWELLVPELEARGHSAVAIDLPIENTSATFTDYGRVIAKATVPGAIVVAHSLGGAAAPFGAVLRPPARLVYLSALLADPGRSMSDQYRDDRPIVALATSTVGPLRDGVSGWLDDASAIDVLFHDCEPAIARGAVARLRGQAQLPQRERCSLARHPDVPTSYVVCRGDRIVSPAWSRRVVPQRLGIEPIEIDGGHSPMLARPAELADLLADLA